MENVAKAYNILINLYHMERKKKGNNANGIELKKINKTQMRGSKDN